MIQRKKPCARDGHSSTNYGRWILIIGGDRHTMPLNDLIWFDMENAITNLSSF